MNNENKKKSRINEEKKKKQKGKKYVNDKQHTKRTGLIKGKTKGIKR
jgi:hypothetical protein